ncbi:hypothetical protein PMAYCL1PPCAC_32136, partial [Pristionchus mayeri]
FCMCRLPTNMHVPFHAKGPTHIGSRSSLFFVPFRGYPFLIMEGHEAQVGTTGKGREKAINDLDAEIRVLSIQETHIDDESDDDVCNCEECIGQSNYSFRIIEGVMDSKAKVVKMERKT